MGKIRKDSSVTTIISFIGLGIGYVNKALLFPVVLLQPQVGLISLIISLSTLFAQLANLGTAHTIMRFFPFIREDRRRQFFLWNLSIVLLGLMLFTALSWVFRKEIYGFYSRESAIFNQYAYWVYFLGAANLFFAFFENFLKAVFQVVLPVMLQEFYLRIAVTFTIVLYALKWVDFDTFLIIHLSVHLLPFIVLMIRVLTNAEITGRGVRSSVPAKMKRLMIRYSSLTYLNTLGSTVVFLLDTIMLAGMSGLAETGNYSTALFISSALMIPYRSVYRVASAFVPGHWKNRSMDKMDALYKRVSSMNLIFILYLVLVVGWNITEFFSFLPPEYGSGILVFFVLTIGRVFDAYGGINGYILVTSKKYYVDVYFTFSLIASAIVLNYFLIPVYGGLGAAWATSIVISLYNILRVLYLWKAYRLSPFEWSNLKVLVIAAVISVPLLFVPFTAFHPVIAVLIKGAYLTGTFVFLVLYFKVEPELNSYYDKLRTRFLGK